MFNFLAKKTAGETVSFKIVGMHCTSCALTIDDALEETEGVYKAETSYAKAKVTVTFDQAKVTPSQLVEVIKDQGYEVAL